MLDLKKHKAKNKSRDDNMQNNDKNMQNKKVAHKMIWKFLPNYWESLVPVKVHHKIDIYLEGP